jgi:hypothetical protein
MHSGSCSAKAKISGSGSTKLLFGGSFDSGSTAGLPAGEGEGAAGAGAAAQGGGAQGAGADTQVLTHLLLTCCEKSSPPCRKVADTSRLCCGRSPSYWSSISGRLCGFPPISYRCAIVFTMLRFPHQGVAVLLSG